MQCLAIIFLVAAAAKRAAADEIPHDGATESREPTIAVGRASPWNPPERRRPNE